MLIDFGSPGIAGLCGPGIVDDLGIPRYWPTAWTSFLPADLASSTVRKKLGRLDSFYQHADSLLGSGGLDNALADLDVEALSNALEGYFFSIRNSSSITPASEERWQAAILFVQEIAQGQSRNNYELLDPESQTNPFQNSTSRWRTYVLFILMLHQGLRRGELLTLPAM